MDHKPIQKPLFSIGVPTFNRKDLLRQTILSILKQDFTDFEIIIGNDFVSEPLTQELIGVKDNRINIINNNHNLGELENMNLLLRMAKGRYFTWQFDDDLCAPTLLREIYQTLEKFDSPLCVFSSFTYIYGNSNHDFPKKKSKGVFLYTGRNFLRSFLSGRIRVLGSAGFYDIDYLKRIGGCKQLSGGKMALYSEYLLIMQTGLLDSIAYVNSQLVANRVHESSWSCNSKEVDLFKHAGINLVHESLLIFSMNELKVDFLKNLTSSLKSVISVVITKNKMAGIKFKKKELSKYISLIKNEFNSLNESGLHEAAMKSLIISVYYIPFFKIKAWLKTLISNRHLKYAHIIVSLISRFTNKSF